MATPPVVPPARSALYDMLKVSTASVSTSTHPPHLSDLASTIFYNLQNQQDWTLLSVHTHSSLTGQPLPRPLLSGLPPRRVYVHPDEQAEILKAEHDTRTHVDQYPEQEWILPTHVAEKWSLEKFAAVFDAIDTLPPVEGIPDDHVENSQVGQKWRGKNRQKRLLLATLHDDSTVVYYIMHDGIVKPRQN